MSIAMFAVPYSAGRYEVDGYVYDAQEEPRMLITGKWNESLSCQPCDTEGEPLPGTTLTEVRTHLEGRYLLLGRVQSS